jgi:hypothetical protein
MHKALLGFALGAVAGIIDVVPMILQKLSWDANLSAFSMWVVIGFFLATSSLRIHAVVQGLLISFLCILPVAIIIGAKEPITLLPIAGMTIILGSLLGWSVRKFT